MADRRIVTVAMTTAISMALLAVTSTAHWPLALAGPDNLACTLHQAWSAVADNPDPPSQPVKLIFVHHSTAGNWLADPNADGPYGQLGIAQRMPIQRLYLPVILKNWLSLRPTPTITPTSRPTATPSAVPVSGRIQPSDLEYLGAFRLPDGGLRPKTFAYGGSSMTFNPAGGCGTLRSPRGDPSGPNDDFPGSLFIMGHGRLPYGELPDGNQVAEITIPLPAKRTSVGALPQAQFLQDFHNVAAGYFPALDELPRTGMQYLDVAATGPKIHLAWGQHLQPDPPDASHAWFNPNLASPNLQGTWFIGNQSLYSVNGYMLEIPASWADQYAQGRYLGTGRFRDGGWSGMGPALFAYRPWVDAAGTPALPGTHLAETVLLLYESSEYTLNIEH